MPKDHGWKDRARTRHVNFWFKDDWHKYLYAFWKKRMPFATEQQLQHLSVQ